MTPPRLNTTIRTPTVFQIYLPLPCPYLMELLLVLIGLGLVVDDVSALVVLLLQAKPPEKDDQLGFRAPQIFN